jgi:NAD(P)-dependent dehydrogenase (short-subunit alcohol dehydrogenase family)
LIPADLRNQKTFEEVLAKHLDRFGYIDILVNNASQQRMCPKIEDLTVRISFFTFASGSYLALQDESIRMTFESNIYQMMHLSKAAVPYMKRGSSIINTTSVTAYAVSNIENVSRPFGSQWTFFA